MKIGKQIALLAIVSLAAIALAVVVARFWIPAAPATVEQSQEQPPAGRNAERETPAGGETETNRNPEAESGEEEAETPEEELLFQSLGSGVCAVIGPGGVKDACVVIPKLSPAGERVVKIASRAFFGCEGITAVQIPETVREIGELAFADCKNLVYISVSPQNTVYCDLDGVLYTADKRVLLQYPPMRAGDPLLLPASVAVVSEMAFYGCGALKSVSYAGSGEDWERIQIGARNYALIASSIRFNETGE